MPSPVNSIFQAAGLRPERCVRWGSAIGRPDGGCTRGVYVIALTEYVDDLSRALPECPVSDDALRGLLEVRRELRMEGGSPDLGALRARIAGFWAPDEVVLYIGRACTRNRRRKKGELTKRVCEYYKTSLGARYPHAGGWSLKTLETLPQLVVYYAYCNDVRGRASNAGSIRQSRLAKNPGRSRRLRTNHALCKPRVSEGAPQATWNHRCEGAEADTRSAPTTAEVGSPADT
jgi:hypothetical protein